MLLDQIEIIFKLYLLLNSQPKLLSHLIKVTFSTLLISDSDIYVRL